MIYRFLDVRRVKEVGADLIDRNDDLAQRTNQQLDIGFTIKRKLVYDVYDTDKIKMFHRGVGIVFSRNHATHHAKLR